ncbi:cupredoxin domain-containing protein [Entomomonas sp. E2T0]|uniref:cupredoxin domain-containing protein n=1 Tax=Entomomonas sp. E2T0 TaxID=2930213 RepID=UPI0022283556|nr:cupredoxin domain-containing protein [Entomomonas sp. E2T0]UYZ85387.1 cupredoxin domain-containing protein [Entomomonas sp. E2T0]
MLSRQFIAFIGLLFITVSAIAAPLPTYEITIKDGVFSPSSIEVPAKQRFKIIVKNIGSGPAEFENLSMRVEKVLAAGVSSFVVIHPLKPGSYHFIDEFHMDMAGFTINVK